MTPLVTDAPSIDALRDVPRKYELRYAKPRGRSGHGYIIIRDPVSDVFVEFNAEMVTPQNIQTVLRQLRSGAAYKANGGVIAA